MTPLEEVQTDAGRFDDESLEHLANKGLVRRAKKLLDSDHGAATTATDTGCTVAGEGWLVEFTAHQPLQDATCGCSTSGVCQHLLASIMKLRATAGTSAAAGEGSADDGNVAEGAAEVTETDAPTAAATTGIEQHLVAMTDADFLAWTKTSDARWATSRAEALILDEVIVARDAYLAIELPAPHPSVRFMGESLDQAIVKPSGRNDRRVVGLAVLALWKLGGRTFDPPASKSTAPINELVEERADVLARTLRLSEDLVTMGLLHLGDPEAERVGSLSSSLRGVKLYRMAILAERAADQIDALADLSANADTARLLEQVAELAILAEATQDRIAAGVALPEGLVGTARAHYELVGHLDLVGLGDYAWGNARFAGTTSVVAESPTRIYSVHSTTRANGRTLTTTARWSGVGSIPSVTGNCFTLADAHASSSARLSSTEKSTATIAGPITAADLRALAWTGTPPSTGSRLLGSPGSTWVVCPVDRVVTDARFDMVEQQVVWEIVSSGQPVAVRLPYREASPAVANLERFAGGGREGLLRKKSDPIQFVVGRLRGSAASTFDLWPISVMVGDQLKNLADTSNTTAPRATSDAPTERIAPVDQLERMAVELTRLGEGGSRAMTTEALGGFRRKAEQAGLAVLSTVIANSPTPQAALLRSAWLLLLARESEG